MLNRAEETARLQPMVSNAPTLIRRSNFCNRRGSFDLYCLWIAGLNFVQSVGEKRGERVWVFAEEGVDPVFEDAEGGGFGSGGDLV